MANIKAKPITELETWTSKELRKLRIEIKNRISSFEVKPEPKKLPEKHPLFGLAVGECKVLLDKVVKAEKSL